MSTQPSPAEEAVTSSNVPTNRAANAVQAGLNAGTAPAHHNIVIVGAGSAGITVAAQLARKLSHPDIAVIDPSDTHYYQPLWTLVGGGVCPKEESQRPMQEVIPPHVKWIKDAAVSFEPEENRLGLRSGEKLSYDYLVVCPGIQVDWDAIPGLPDTLGSNGVCSNYSYQHCEYTWHTVKNLPRGGRALFTQPDTPIKCGGAPQKIMYLTADYQRNQGRLANADIEFFSPGSVIFGVEEFAETLKDVIRRYGITTNFHHNLIEIRGEKQEAVFQVTGGDGQPVERVEPFDMLHVVPPMSAPDFLKDSPVANEDGWVDVDKHTTQHVHYENIFSLGDASGLPNAKTGAAIRKQAPVLVENLLQHRQTGHINRPKTYNGYASCPLVTGYGKLILAEFDYDNNPDPSFPIDTTKERYSMYQFKRYGLPSMYWNLMLKGLA
ncbi:NAD(P)/FAD-dependent oxidoreductase [Salisaeta longa]|uniref:NAD(P)/FAD-dependent oxidoreductase n=1 Tax=Salisaeta longa TaxID=503170 RepID=UPI000429221E|nr:FAD/NAD(P)-binding oxidoreductase [Salisaeta longa]